MVLRDLSGFFDDDGLDYPAIPSTTYPDGKTYRVASPDARTGLRLTALAEAAMRVNNGRPVSDDDVKKIGLDDLEELNLYQEVLGPVYDEMVADGVKWTLLQHVGQDAFLSFTMSQAVADAALESQLGKARTQSLIPATARKTAGSKSNRASTGTRARTRKPASTRSSTSPNARKPATVKAAG